MIINTKHFLERIKQREIELKDVNDLLDNEKIKPVNDTSGNYIKQKNIDGYLLRVFLIMIISFYQFI